MCRYTARRDATRLVGGSLNTASWSTDFIPSDSIEDRSTLRWVVRISAFSVAIMMASTSVSRSRGPQLYTVAVPNCYSSLRKWCHNYH